MKIRFWKKNDIWVIVLLLSYPSIKLIFGDREDMGIALSMLFVDSIISMFYFVASYSEFLVNEKDGKLFIKEAIYKQPREYIISDIERVEPNTLNGKCIGINITQSDGKQDTIRIRDNRIDQIYKIIKCRVADLTK